MKSLPRLLVFLAGLTGSAAFSQTVGLISHLPGSLDSGYVLIAPPNDTTYLIDKCGKLIHLWPGNDPGPSFVYLLPNGNILRTGHYQSVAGTLGGGKTQLIDWDGNLLWRYVYGDSTHLQHHDICLLPNGNILCLVMEIHQNAEALSLGRDSFPLGDWLGSEEIVEIQPVGTDTANVVWIWRVWDHLIQDRFPTMASYGAVADHPELINFNYMPHNASLTDWLHINCIKFDSANNVIMVSVHNFGEVWMIDHSTTTFSGASHSGGHFGRGGDLLYRWGNPEAYNRGTPNNEVFFGQHYAYWIPKGYPDEGKICVYNNGLNRLDSDYTSVDFFTPALDSPGVHLNGTQPYLPVALDKRYTDPWPTHFYSITQGNAQVLSNGNLLMCNGKSGELFEVDTAWKQVWKYMVPITNGGPLTQGVVPPPINQFHVTFYPWSYAAFNGRTLTAGAPLEYNPLNYDCTLDVIVPVKEPAQTQMPDDFFVYPNPASDHVVVSPFGIVEYAMMFNSLGQKILEWENAGEVNTGSLPAGIYRVVIRRLGKMNSRMISIVR